MCSLSGVAMLGNDGTDFKNQVPDVRCEWLPVVTSCHGTHLMLLFPEVLALVVPARYRKPPGEAGGTREHPRPREETEWADRCRNPFYPRLLR
jgi:hypothetical protein